MSGLCGCTLRNNRHSDPQGPPCVVAVAPVLNLSNSVDFDPLRVTDILAAEFQSFSGVLVVPVNRVLATLELMERDGVLTASDALELGRELNADAVVVAAVTDFSPYDPPRFGLVLQWYAQPRREAGFSRLDPVAASRRATDWETVSDAAGDPRRPTWQVQASYSGASRDVLEDIRRYDRARGGHDSPFGWKVHVKSQEAFVRYCCWATLRSMLLARAEAWKTGSADEAHE